MISSVLCIVTVGWNRLPYIPVLESTNIARLLNKNIMIATHMGRKSLLSRLKVTALIMFCKFSNLFMFLLFFFFCVSVSGDFSNLHYLVVDVQLFE